MWASMLHDPHVTGPNYSCLLPSHSPHLPLLFIFYLYILVMLLQLVVVRFMFNFQSTANRGFKKQWNILHKFVLMFLYSKKNYELCFIMLHTCSNLHTRLFKFASFTLHRWCPEWENIHRNELVHLLLSIEDNNLI